MENRVQEFRRLGGWTQERLAADLGVTRQTVISIERGRFDPSLTLAFKLAEVFGVKIEDLFTP